MPDLPTYIWMRQQWRTFRRVLLGALTGVLIVCASGLFFLDGSVEEEGETDWFVARASLMLLLVTSSAVTAYLYIRATLEIRSLSRLASEARLEQSRTAREKRPRPRRRGDTG